MRLRALAICAALLAGPVAAQDPAWNCGDYANLPQQGINWCLGQAYQRADDALNAVYQQAMGRASPAMSSLLRDAQRAWIPFRDAACEAEAEFMRGGSGEAMMRLGCLTRETEARTEVLRMFADGW